MNPSPNDSRLTPTTIQLPCAESCAAYHPITANGWSDYGICTNRQAPGCGYPVRPGKDCKYYQVSANPRSEA
jgi:hypothetical protein